MKTKPVHVSGLNDLGEVQICICCETREQELAAIARVEAMGLLPWIV